MEETAGALVPFLEVINTTFERNGPHYLAGDCRYDDRGKCGAVQLTRMGAAPSCTVAELHSRSAPSGEQRWIWRRPFCGRVRDPREPHQVCGQLGPV